jgi:hypothetical protein
MGIFHLVQFAIGKMRECRNPRRNGGARADLGRILIPWPPVDKISKRNQARSMQEIPCQRERHQ